jgi:hypothetical protein
MMLHHALDSGFESTLNARVVGSWKLPPRFQRKAWEATQCVAVSDVLKEAPDRVSMKLPE